MDKQSKILLSLIVFIGIIACLMLLAYIINFRYGISDDSSDWGNFGSYMGAITGLLAFVGVLYSIHNANKQSAEAKKEAENVRSEAAKEDKLIRDEARAESKRLREETRRETDKLREEARSRDERDLFFKLVDSHLSSIETVTYFRNGDTHMGREAIHDYLVRLNRDLDLLLFWLHVDKCQELTEILPLGKLYEIMYKNVIFGVSKYNRSYRDDVPIQEYFPVLLEYVHDIISNKEIHPLHERYEEDDEERIRTITSKFRNTLDEDNIYAVLSFIGHTLGGELGNGISYHFSNIIFITQTINTFLEGNRRYYMNYWRSKLSVEEVYILFFYLLSERVDNDIRSIFIKYDLLQNNGSRNVFDLNVKDETTTQLFNGCLQKRVDGVPAANIPLVDINKKIENLQSFFRIAK